jgi:DNA-binding SARP family transcriptional activator/DNA-binding beta-propeller fold protein YncE
LPLGGTKQRAVLALLLLRANEVVPLDRLIDELWGESPPDSAANIVQGYVSHLRKALEPDRGRGKHEVLVSRQPGYILKIGQDQYDADRFVRLSGEGRRLLEEGDADSASERLRAALDLWRGPALADLAYESFARLEAERLEELRLVVLEDRIDADLALGRNGVLVGELRELVAHYPLRERLRAQLMAALYRAGRQAEALEVYREGRVALSDELGIEPGPALRELERAILQQDPTLCAPAVPPMRVSSRLRRRWLLLAVAVVVAGAAAAAILATRGGSGVAAPVTVYPHSVAVIDPANAKVVDDVLVGDYPTTFAADSRYVYVVNNGEATVSRIDPQTRRVSDTTALSRAIDLIAVGDHLWAANGGAPGHTPLGVGPGTVLDYGPVPTLRTIRVGPSIDGSEEQTTLAARGPDALAIWVGNQDSRTVREIDSSLDRVLQTIHGVAPGGLAVVGSAAGETVWASDPSRNVVVRIDGNTRRIVHRIRIPGRPTRLAVDGSAVWVITSGPKGVLSRIDTRTNEVVTRIPLGITPKRVALGAGSVWVTGYKWSNHHGSSTGGTVIRVDPETNRIRDRIPLGDLAADGIIVSHGLVWVAVPPSA